MGRPWLTNDCEDVHLNILDHHMKSVCLCACKKKKTKKKVSVTACNLEPILCGSYDPSLTGGGVPFRCGQDFSKRPAFKPRV